MKNKKTTKNKKKITKKETKQKQKRRVFKLYIMLHEEFPQTSNSDCISLVATPSWDPCFLFKETAASSRHAPINLGFFLRAKGPSLLLRDGLRRKELEYCFLNTI